MPSSRARARAPRAALAALLGLTAAATAACHRADPEVVPFAVRITDAAGGPVLPNVAPGEPLVLVGGPATLAGEGVLRVTDPVLGLVTVTFDAASHPGVRFPPRLDGQEVRVHAQYNPAAVAPGGAPLPYPAMRVALLAGGDLRYQFLLADSPYDDGTGLPAMPRPINPEERLGDALDPNDPAFPDHPLYSVAASHARFEAGACGLVYHDVLVAEGAALQAGEEAQTVLLASPAPWTSRHVDSWHRTGACPGHAKTWTQWAAWR